MSKKKIIQLVRENPTITNQEIAQQLKKPSSTITNVVTSMIKDGLLSRIGKRRAKGITRKGEAYEEEEVDGDTWE